MRLQTMYVDMRPVLTKWVGLLLLALSLTALFLSAMPDISRALRTFQMAFREVQGGVSPWLFWKSCVQAESCWRGLLLSWSAPRLEQALYLAGILFGSGCSGFGMWWRPEVVSLRDLRLNANRVERSKHVSPVPPRRLL